MFSFPNNSPIVMLTGMAQSAMVDIHLFSELSSQHIEIPNFSPIVMLTSTRSDYNLT